MRRATQGCARQDVSTLIEAVQVQALRSYDNLEQTKRSINVSIRGASLGFHDGCAQLTWHLIPGSSLSGLCASSRTRLRAVLQHQLSSSLMPTFEGSIQNKGPAPCSIHRGHSRQHLISLIIDRGVERPSWPSRAQLANVDNRFPRRVST